MKYDAALNKMCRRFARMAIFEWNLMAWCLQMAVVGLEDIFTSSQDMVSVHLVEGTL